MSLPATLTLIVTICSCVNINGPEKNRPFYSVFSGALFFNAPTVHYVTTRNTNEKPIIHSDRGGHYRWPEWVNRVKRAGLTRSMSRKGCSSDNAACEGFFGRLKNEMFYNRSWKGVRLKDFIKRLDEYLH